MRRSLIQELDTVLDREPVELLEDSGNMVSGASARK